MGLPIPNVMLTDAIKHSESYQMFIKYSTNQIPPKKSIGKGSKGKKTAEESQETVDVSEESEPEPEPAKKKTSGKRRAKKKVTLSPDDNIISDDPNAALELAKSISQTKAEEAEAARKVHATHARIMNESVPESAKKKSSGRSSKSVVIQDTLSTPKSKPATSKTKLKGASSLTPQEQEVAYIMQALKESKKTSRRQLGTEGLNEGTGSKPGVPDESTVVSATSSEGTDEQDSEFSDDDNDDVEKDDKDGDADDEGDDHVSDTQYADDEDVKIESDEDEIYKYKIRARNEEDVEMKDANVEESDKGEEKVTDAAKEKAQKTSEAKDDTKKSKLPPSSSSLSVSSDVSYLLDIPIQHETPQTQSPSVQKIPVSVIPHNTQNLPPIPEFVMKLQFSTVVFSIKVTPIFSSMQQTPTPIPTPPITTDSPTVTTVVPKSNALTVHLPELPKKPTPTSEQEFEKSPSDILKIKRERAEKQKMSQFTIKSIDKAALEEYDLKSALYQSMHANKTLADGQTGEDDQEEMIRKESESSKKPSTTKETPKVEEPIAEVVMDDVGDDVAHDDYQPQDTSKPKTRKTLNPDWFKQPLRPPTLDPDGTSVSSIELGVTISRVLQCFNSPLCHRTVVADYFFNNDLEYLKTSDPEVTYTTSITKIKAARYEIKGIEDMVLTFWSAIKHTYDKDAEKGIKH
ncbi:hypothetical protein Tco_0320690 [Tanacetum coccineum]